jgi:hypothetical protein
MMCAGETLSVVGDDGRSALFRIRDAVKERDDQQSVQTKQDGRQVTKGVWEHRMRLVKEPAVQNFEQRATIRYARSNPPGPTAAYEAALVKCR